MSNKEWVDKNIYWLTSMLSVKDDVFRKNYDSPPDLYRHFESGKTEDAQKAIDLISKHLGIVPPILHYDWSGELDHDTNIKGQMTRGQLTVSLTFTVNKYLLAATAIHELMHYYLIQRNYISLPDQAENEKITDLSAIVLGLGSPMLNGKVISIEDKQIRTLGYLSLEEIAYAYKKIHDLRKMIGYSYLTSDSLRIMNGTITKNNSYHGQSASSSDITLESVKKSFLLMNKSIKKLFINSKQNLSNIINSSKKKSCPFCHRQIQKDTVICKFCKRTLIEKL
jgi:hypothetical protein